MIFKKDSILLGLILGAFAPLMGLVIFKMYKFSVFSFRETFQYMTVEPGFRKQEGTFNEWPGEGAHAIRNPAYRRADLFFLPAP